MQLLELPNRSHPAAQQDTLELSITTMDLARNPSSMFSSRGDEIVKTHCSAPFP